MPTSCLQSVHNSQPQQKCTQMLSQVAVGCVSALHSLEQPFKKAKQQGSHSSSRQANSSDMESSCMVDDQRCSTIPCKMGAAANPSLHGSQPVTPTCAPRSSHLDSKSVSLAQEGEEFQTPSQGVQYGLSKAHSMAEQASPTSMVQGVDEDGFGQGPLPSDSLAPSDSNLAGQGATLASTETAARQSSATYSWFLSNFVWQSHEHVMAEEQAATAEIPNEDCMQCDSEEEEEEEEERPAGGWVSEALVTPLVTPLASSAGQGNGEDGDEGVSGLMALADAAGGRAPRVSMEAGSGTAEVPVLKTTTSAQAPGSARRPHITVMDTGMILPPPPSEDTSAVVVVKALTRSDATTRRIILPRISIEANLPQAVGCTAFPITVRLLRGLYT